MNLATYLLLGAMIIQLLAAIHSLRIRLNGRSFWVICLMFVVILVFAGRSAIAFFRGVDAAGHEALFSDAIGLSAAWGSLAASVSALVIVALLKSVRDESWRRESMMQEQRDRLAQAVLDANHESEVARQVRQRLLPFEPLRWRSLDIAGNCCFARDTTSNHLIDYFPASDEDLFVYTADISGRGLDGAMITMQVRRFIRSRVGSGIRDPLAIANQVNAFLTEHAIGQIARVFMARIDPFARCITFANAGLPAWLIDSNGLTRQLGSNPLPLGMEGELQLKGLHWSQFPPGSALLLATEGLFGSSSRQEAVDLHRALQLIYSHLSESSQTIAETLFCELRNASRECLADDVSAVLVKHLSMRHDRGMAGRNLSRASRVQDAQEHG